MTDKEKEKALLVGVDTGEEDDFPRSMKELGELAKACNMTVAGVVTQKMAAVNKAYYIGAATQFILSAAKGVDIKMYSTGEQIRTFSYVADCVSGILTALTRGVSKKVYGISSGERCSVREFAMKCAVVGKCRVEMCIPDSVRKLETSPIADQIVNNVILRELGWRSAYSLDDGIRNSIQIMKDDQG